MDVIFNCPKCNQELEVDSAGIGEEIDCPQCGGKIVIPGEPEAAPPGGEAAAPVPEPAAPQAPAAPLGASPIAASAAARQVRQLRVPVHDKPSEKLIDKPAVPLEVAAKISDRTMKVKTIRHIDCVEVGHDRFDEVVSAFLNKVGEQFVVSITAVSYSHLDISSQKLIEDFGVLIVYKG